MMKGGAFVDNIFEYAALFLLLQAILKERIMKRFLTFVFLCFCVLLAFPKYVGDVNEDGRITIADVTALVNILLGKEDQYDSRLVDVNGDSKLSIADVTALVNILLGTEQAHELVEESADTLFIHYGTDGPTYKLPSAWEPYVTVAINGNDVAVTNTNLTDEYVTALSGSCADGSFAYMGSFKTTLVLNGLTLTNQRGTCIDIEDGKRYPYGVYTKCEASESTYNLLTEPPIALQMELRVRGLSSARGISRSVKVEPLRYKVM